MNKLKFSLVPGWFFVAGDYRSKRYETWGEAMEHHIEELLVLAVQIYCSEPAGEITVIDVQLGC